LVSVAEAPAFFSPSRFGAIIAKLRATIAAASSQSTLAVEPHPDPADVTDIARHDWALALCRQLSDEMTDYRRSDVCQSRLQVSELI
jgi:hypothetical protein